MTDDLLVNLVLSTVIVMAFDIYTAANIREYPFLWAGALILTSCHDAILAMACRNYRRRERPGYFDTPYHGKERKVVDQNTDDLPQ
jgi:hypothetical protein